MYIELSRNLGVEHVFDVQLSYDGVYFESLDKA